MTFYKSNWFSLSNNRPAENCFEGRSYPEQQLQTELDLLWDCTTASARSFSLPLAQLCAVPLYFAVLVIGVISGSVALHCIIKLVVPSFRTLIQHLPGDSRLKKHNMNSVPVHQKPNEEAVESEMPRAHQAEVRPLQRAPQQGWIKRDHGTSQQVILFIMPEVRNNPMTCWTYNVIRCKYRSKFLCSEGGKAGRWEDQIALHTWRRGRNNFYCRSGKSGKGGNIFTAVHLSQNHRMV